MTLIKYSASLNSRCNTFPYDDAGDISRGCQAISGAADGLFINTCWWFSCDVSYSFFKEWFGSLQYIVLIKLDRSQTQ